MQITKGESMPVAVERLPARTTQNYKRVNDGEIEESRLQIADMMLRGYNQDAIANALGITRQQVSLDQQAIKRKWLSKTHELVGEWFAVELEKLRVVEEEMWAAWRNSQRQVILSQSETGENVEVIDTPGDIRFLEGVLKVMTDRAKRLGLYAPEKKEFIADPIRHSLVIPEGGSYGDTLRAVAETLDQLRNAGTEDTGRIVEYYQDTNGREYSDDEGMRESLDAV